MFISGILISSVALWIAAVVYHLNTRERVNPEKGTYGYRGN